MPAGIQIPQNILNSHAISPKQVIDIKKVMNILLGVKSSVGDSRRQCTFRVILGSIFMVFGVLFLQTNLFTIDGCVEPFILVSMVAGGVMIACGLLTRMVSFCLGLILMMAFCQYGMETMTGFSMLVCVAACFACMVTGSGRFSLDTMLYNMIVRRGA